MKNDKEIKREAHSKVSTKMPILYVDVCVGDLSQRLFIHEGEKSDRVAEDFCIRNSIF